MVVVLMVERGNCDMKRILTLIGKTLLLTVIFAVANYVGILLAPFSDAFREMSAGTPPSAGLYLLVLGLWNAIILGLVVHKSRWGGIATSLYLLLILFIISYFQTQVETIIFREALTTISVYDALMLMVSGVITLVIFVPIGVLMHGGFKRQYNPLQDDRLKLQNKWMKLGILSVVYVAIYFLFGYFVAWQFPELRLYYSGSTENLGLLYQLRTSLGLVPLQLIRGAVFTLSAMGLRYVLNQDKMVFVVSVAMLFMTSGIMMLLPNPIFPDAVRIGHLYELLSSMMVYGLITGLVLDASPRQPIRALYN